MAKILQITQAVLIESDWNLKENMESQQRSEKAVLIESDWNLKM